ncbi:uncharacterized protein Triagg1_6480 [Trichoderma aggressivum f. europaeum]|uniref:Uncharacterized protein n=1 Tax=Trichoderma aggressivum f. europaeum TaxID=173218 RepID=A0AAE1M3R0_9HYPO|nr:hypothetical protein Triagg1_6480 [Trichoderma aggressivum f. europaeum]
MPRRRKAGSQPASYNLRWHSIADPNTPSVDIMSSPDPLNEPTSISYPSFAPQSTSRRVSRSPQRRISLASPRKQNLLSPRRLLEPGETEGDDDMASASSGTRRKLFKSPVQSPTVRRRADDTITTTVPLRESAEDELTAAVTPSRRRSRARPSNGTPLPTAGVKRRAGSPISRNPRRIRDERFTGGNTEELHFDEKENVQATPATAKRGRPPKNKAVQPSSELGTAKRGRRRRAMAPDELVGITEEAALERSLQDIRRPSETQPPSRRRINGSVPGADAASNADTESMDDDDEPTPKASAQPSTISLPSKNRPLGAAGSRDTERAPEASDHSTVDEHHDFSSQTNDTIAQGEDFSMIFMDSIPSLQNSYIGNSTAHDDDELGEDTHIIINNTLASLRQEVAQTSDPVDITEAIEIPEVPELEDSPEKEVEFIPIIRESARNARLSDSPWWSRKPKKIGSSPTRHQTTLLRSAAKRSGRLFKFDQREEEPTPTKIGKRPTSAHSRESQSKVYEDSFSEIPQNFLDSATPKPINFAATRTEREVDLMEYGLHGEEEEPAEEEPAQHTEEPAEDDVEEHGEEDAEEVADEGLLTAQIQRTAGPSTIRLPTPPSPDIISSPVRDVVEESEDEAHEDIKGHEEFEEREGQEEYEEHAEQEESEHAEQEEFQEHEEHEEDLELELDLELEEEGEEEQLTDREEHHEEMGNNEEEAEVEEFEEHGLQDEEEEEVEQLEEDMEEDEEPQEEEGEHDEHGQIEEYKTHEHEHERRHEHEHDEDEDNGHEHDEHVHDEQEEHEEPLYASHRLGANLFARRQLAHKDYYADEEMRSDPLEQPEQLEPTPEYEAQPVKATPLHQMSSPLQDPQTVPPEPVQYPAIRPVLSSIMRAGRVLQNVTSDPPSPGDREKHLGSPFRSSASKESSQGAKDDRYQLSSRSPPQMFPFGRDQSTINRAPVSPRVTANTEAFSVSISGVRRPLDIGAKELLHRKRPSSRESVASSLGNTPPSGSATNWFEREGPISPLVRGVNSFLQSSRFSSIRHAIPFVQVDGAGEDEDEEEERAEEEGAEEDEEDEEVEEQEQEQEVEAEEEEEEEEEQEEFEEPEQLDEPEELEPELEPEQDYEEQMQEPEPEEDEEEEEEDEDEDDDIDIWEYEARREVPPHQEPQQQPLMPLAQEHGTAPSHSSSWRDANRAPAAAVAAPNNLSKSSRMKQSLSRRAEEKFEGEEHSVISRNQQEQEPATASKSKRFDLSSFFSSPAAIPGLLVEKFMSPKSKNRAEATVQQAEPAKPRQEPPTVPATSIFSRPPQNGIGPRTVRRKDPISSTVRPVPLADEQVAQQSASPGTPPEEPSLPVIAQKQNFTPRPRQSSESFFQPSSSLAAATPPRMQLTHDDIQRWQLETSNASGSSPTSPSALRPLPSKHASPKKSSLRSPLKPHTPGRVVEFTSSVLSPQDQAQVREKRSRANANVSQEDIRATAAVPTHAEPRAGKGSMGRQQQHPPQRLAPKIVKPAGVTKKRSTKKRGGREPPSETVWTRGHWIFLDTLLQMRRQRPFSEEYEPVSRRYLGKVVTSMGESLVLQKWHLECVDAFKSQIGGWDEGELAKRLFALILGEAQRRRNSVGSSPGVIFH